VEALNVAALPSLSSYSIEKEGSMLFSMRVSLRDQPGALGSLASALGSMGANIVTLDVIDRGNGEAVDDLCVEVGDGGILAEALRKAAEEVPGAIVEAVRPIPHVHSTSSPMDLAAAIVEAGPSLALQTLTDGMPGALWASWAVALRPGSPPEVLAATAGAPSMSNVETPWLPLDRSRRFSPAPWMPPAWCMGRMSYEIAAAPLRGVGGAILIARKYGPGFRPSEVEQLGLLTRVLEGVLGDRLLEPI
jgi:ACT domain-containing protein